MAITGQHIKQRRESLQLTQGELAELLGVALNTVSRWENGSSLPESGKMLELALAQIEFQKLLELDASALAQVQKLQESKAALAALLNAQTKGRRKLNREAK